MIDRTHRLLIRRQAEALGIARSTDYPLPRPIPERDQQLMKCIDRLHQVWAMDLTYIPMARGFVYLVPVLD